MIRPGDDLRVGRPREVPLVANGQKASPLMNHTSLMRGSYHGSRTLVVASLRLNSAAPCAFRWRWSAKPSSPIQFDATR